MKECSKDKADVKAATQRGRRKCKAVFHLESVYQVHIELRFFF